MKRIHALVLALLMTMTLFTFAAPVTVSASTSTTAITSTSSVMKVKSNKMTVCKGKSVQLKATYKGKVVTTKAKWTSSRKSVVTVTSKGKITAKKAGTAYITAKYNNKTVGKIKITVKSSHSYTAATCTKAKTCKVCGKTSGTALGHSWVENYATRTVEVPGETVDVRYCCKCEAGPFFTYQEWLQHAASCGNGVYYWSTYTYPGTTKTETYATGRTCSVCGKTENY